MIPCARSFLSLFNQLSVGALSQNDCLASLHGDTIARLDRLLETMNKPILITGCQRSGTTLLNLILDSHPDITGIDEMDFGRVPLSEYLNNPAYSPCVAFKLPMASFEFQSIKSLPGVKVVWCIRDPRDVVLSMMNLTLQVGEDATLPWVAHPLGAGREIENSVGALQKHMHDELADLYKTYREISGKPPASWSLEDKIFVASLCWRMKQEVLLEYDEQGIFYRIQHYEDLLRNPESSIRGILDFIGLPWHENVLKHHQLHSGVSVGNTVNTRPIDASNTRKWLTVLDAQSLAIISALCAEIAAQHDYQLLGS